MDHAVGHGHVGDLDAVLVLLQPHVVADADLGQDDAQVGGHVLPHPLDSLQQVAAAARIGQADQADADLDLHRIDGQVVLDALLGRFRRFGLFLRRRRRRRLVVPPRQGDRHHRATGRQWPAAESAACS